MGTFTGVRKYVLHTFATTQSALMKKRVARYMSGTLCPECAGKRLKRAALTVKFAGLDIGEIAQLPLSKLAVLLKPAASAAPLHQDAAHLAATRMTQNMLARIATLQELGLGYLSLDRITPTLSPGELQRLRLATQIRSNLFGVVYVLDEPSAGLHPADTEALLVALDALKNSGNSLFVVEHDLEVMRHADWIVDVGPDAGEHGGRVLYSGPLDGLRQVESSHTGRYLFANPAPRRQPVRKPAGWLKLSGITRNNLRGVDVEFPLGLFTVITGVSGSGKSSLVSQALVELLSAQLGQAPEPPEAEEGEEPGLSPLQPTAGRIVSGAEHIRRLVTIDQKPIGRTPRSNLATYTGLFDHVRRLFASTPAARRQHFDAGRFSFNVAKGRCPTCEGEGAVSVELLFMPSVYAPCPTCKGARYNDATLKIRYRDKNIADVLAMTVGQASEFFADEAAVIRPLRLLSDIGLGYLGLGQPATDLSGGEAQRVKLATELQRVQHGNTLYVIDEPTIGLHPADVDKLMIQLEALVDAGNSVIVAEHEMRVAAAADWIIDLGPGAGDQGGRIVATGTPEVLAKNRSSRTAPYLAQLLTTG
jgi:excinuclease ABC subunit A